MQPRTVGPKPESLIEREATIPKCVYDVIKAIPGQPVSSITQYMDSIPFPFCSNHRTATAHFDTWIGRNASTHSLGKRLRINRDFRCGEGSKRYGRIELCLLFRGRPGSDLGA